MNGAFVGTWRLDPLGGDVLEYAQAWVDSEEGRPLSLSLPFTPANTHRGPKVRAYFDNLLPDSQAIRQRIAGRFGTGATDAFALLTEIGRDCVGALQLLPDGSVPGGVRPVQAERLSEAQVAQVLRRTVAPPVIGMVENDDFRISIAGAQEKTALLYRDGCWYVPRGDTPTTHILKLPLGLVGGFQYDLRDSVENEFICSLILQEFGLPVAHCEPVQFEDMKALAVERFDRLWWESPSGDSLLVRLPQEDMCQARGIPLASKYESEGGPGIDDIMNVLAGSMARDADRRTFFEAQLVFWLLRATDGHAKNFSLFLRPQGRYRLTPLYDVLSAYPLLGEGPGKISPFNVRMAMAVRSRNSHYRMREIRRRHWLALAQRHGVLTHDGRPGDDLIDSVLQRVPGVVQTVRNRLPKSFPESLASSILDGMAEEARKLAE